MSKSIFIIAFYTLKEILKSKILISVFFAGLLLVIATYVATEFTYGVPERVALDFGMGMLSLSSLGISLFLGVTLLSREIDSRTVYMMISRPVPRSSFILGKISGLLSVQAINMCLLSAMTLFAVKVMGGVISPLIYWCILFIFVESILLLLLVIFASLISNTILASLFSFIVLVLGHAIRETQNLSIVKRSESLQYLLDVYHFVLPAFYKLNIKDFLIYNSSLSDGYLWANLAYGILYSLFLLFLIIIIFKRKNLD
jgi:ABC-type transport system involved in multi-copper enzyme maturation permease subunit